MVDKNNYLNKSQTKSSLVSVSSLDDQNNVSNTTQSINSNHSHFNPYHKIHDKINDIKARLRHLSESNLDQLEEDLLRSASISNANTLSTNTASIKPKTRSNSANRHSTSFVHHKDINNSTANRIKKSPTNSSMSSISEILSEIKRLLTVTASATNQMDPFEETIIKSKDPIEISNNDLEKNEEIDFGNGERGVWINKIDEEKWTGPLPLDQYPLNLDKNPRFIIKKPTEILNYTQSVAIRYLRPSSPPQPGEIIIKQLENILVPPAPPLIIRQRPPRPETPEPLVIREAPPTPPEPIGRKVITIYGKRLPPPPRKVVIERLAPLPEKPQSVIIERWLSYPEAKRRVIYHKPADSEPIIIKPKNVVIQWEAPCVSIQREYKFLGTIKANPQEYVQRYRDSLKHPSQLPEFVKEMPKPDGLKLAAEVLKTKNDLLPELEGDLDALNLIDLDAEGLSSYKRYLTTKSNPKLIATSSLKFPTPISTSTMLDNNNHNNNNNNFYNNNNNNNNSNNKVIKRISFEMPRGSADSGLTRNSSSFESTNEGTPNIRRRYFSSSEENNNKASTRQSILKNSSYNSSFNNSLYDFDDDDDGSSSIMHIKPNYISLNHHPSRPSVSIDWTQINDEIANLNNLNEALLKNKSDDDLTKLNNLDRKQQINNFNKLQSKYQNGPKADINNNDNYNNNNNNSSYIPSLNATNKSIYNLAPTPPFLNISDIPIANGNNRRTRTCSSSCYSSSLNNTTDQLAYNSNYSRLLVSPNAKNCAEDQHDFNTSNDESKINKTMDNLLLNANNDVENNSDLNIKNYSYQKYGDSILFHGPIQPNKNNATTILNTNKSSEELKELVPGSRSQKIFPAKVSQNNKTAETPKIKAVITKVLPAPIFKKEQNNQNNKNIFRIRI